uniref:hypothetical protein n=1 Tax=Singerocybe alboinfundibuliformis TaxID=1346812 RepID=UPI0030FF37FB
MFILEILKNYGVDLYDSNTPPVVLLCLIIIILVILSILCFLNIMFYFVVLFSVEREYVQNIITKYKLLGKIIKFYHKTSYLFIGIEIIFFIWINSIIFYICFNIVYGYYSNI